MRSYLLLFLACAAAACASNHANSPVKAPGHHQDLWDDVACRANPSATEMVTPNVQLYGLDELTGCRDGTCS